MKKIKKEAGKEGCKVYLRDMINAMYETEYFANERKIMATRSIMLAN